MLFHDQTYFRVCQPLLTKDLDEYWQNNEDLATGLQMYWGDSGPTTMEKVFPFRFYGGGADTTGLNAFELLTMISVAPNHTSSMKTRFVFPGHNFVDSGMEV